MTFSERSEICAKKCVLIAMISAGLVAEDRGVNRVRPAAPFAPARSNGRGIPFCGYARTFVRTFAVSPRA